MFQFGSMIPAQSIWKMNQQCMWRFTQFLSRFMRSIALTKWNSPPLLKWIISSSLKCNRTNLAAHSSSKSIMGQSNNPRHPTTNDRGEHKGRGPPWSGRGWNPHWAYQGKWKAQAVLEVKLQSWLRRRKIKKGRYHGHLAKSVEPDYIGSYLGRRKKE